MVDRRLALLDCSSTSTVLILELLAPKDRISYYVLFHILVTSQLLRALSQPVTSALSIRKRQNCPELT